MKCIVITVVRAMRFVCVRAEPMAVMVMMFGLGSQPMQPFAEERDAGESDQQEIAQNSSIL
jgi:hypothetical protein